MYKTTVNSWGKLPNYQLVSQISEPSTVWNSWRIGGFDLLLVFGVEKWPDKKARKKFLGILQSTLQDPRTGWWFQTFFIFPPTWGNYLIWLIFFKGVETTNQKKGSKKFGVLLCFFQIKAFKLYPIIASDVQEEEMETPLSCSTRHTSSHTLRFTLRRHWLLTKEDDDFNAKFLTLVVDGLPTISSTAIGWCGHSKWIYNMDVSKNRGTPKWMVKIMENPIKMDDLGVPLFLETPISLWLFRHSEWTGLPDVDMLTLLMFQS